MLFAVILLPPFWGLCEIMETFKAVVGKRVMETVSQVLCVVCACVGCMFSYCESKD